MGEMIERVARALYPQNFRSAPTGDFARQVQAYSLKQARIALIAMREPADKMIEQGLVYLPGATPDQLRAAWRIMVDMAGME